MLRKKYLLLSSLLSQSSCDRILPAFVEKHKIKSLLPPKRFQSKQFEHKYKNCNKMYSFDIVWPADVATRGESLMPSPFKK